MDSARRIRTATVAAGRIAVIYLACAAAWILFSDIALNAVISDPALIRTLEIYKGLAFVAITAVLVFFMTRAHFRRLEQAHELERDGHERLRRLAFELSAVEERERRRISELIHDRIGQILSLQKIELSMLRREVRGAMLERIERLVENADTAINEARLLSWDLSPALLYQFGLTSALEQVIADFRTRTGIDTETRLEEFESTLDPDVAILVYRIATELLANIAKHSGATSVNVSLERDGDQLRLAVVDDGHGFDAPAMLALRSRPKHFGLFSILERVRAVGGELAFDSTPGTGTKVHLTVPFRTITRMDRLPGKETGR